MYKYFQDILSFDFERNHVLARNLNVAACCMQHHRLYKDPTWLGRHIPYPGRNILTFQVRNDNDGSWPASTSYTHTTAYTYSTSYIYTHNSSVLWYFVWILWTKDLVCVYAMNRPYQRTLYMPTAILTEKERCRHMSKKIYCLQCCKCNPSSVHQLLLGLEPNNLVEIKFSNKCD